jgi:hypothetical protein
LLLGVALMTLAVAATSGMFLASKSHMRMQALELETTQAARAALDMLVRDLRLGGACLPVTGEFISLSGVDNGDEDALTTRTGLTRADLSCIRTATTAVVSASGTSITVEDSAGFSPGARAYIRHPNGSGEYFDITNVPSATSIGRSATLAVDYPPTSGIYAIDERRYYINWFTSPKGLVLPELMIQIGSEVPISFAVGIEKLAIDYILTSNCPSCDIVDLPADNAEWSIVDQVRLGITGRSQVPNQEGDYYRRTLSVSVKPRNILPR